MKYLSKRMHNVLFIDDNDLDSYYINFITRHEALPIIPKFITDGLEALKYLEECTDYPEIVFVDVHMPLITGFEFVEKFLEQLPNIALETPIFMLSSSFMEMDRAQTNNFPNIVDYIIKPFSKAIFYDKILPVLLEVNEPEIQS